MFVKITADGDCSHEIIRRLLLGRKVMTNLDSILKYRDRDFPGGPVAETLCSQSRGPRVQSLVRELDLTCCN